MKKILFCIICVVLTYVASVNAACITAENRAQEVYDNLPVEARDILGELGVDSAAGTDIFDISPSGAFSAIVNICRSHATAPIAFGARMLVMIICVMLLKGFSNSYKDIMSLFCTLMCAACAVTGISDCINALMSSTKVCSAFILMYVPVFAVLLTLCGSPASGITYNAVVLAFCEGLSGVSSAIMLPASGILMSFGISFSVNTSINSEKLTGAVNKCITWVSAVSMSFFASVLGLRGIMAGSADGLASKGVKLALSSFIPIIGSALSEAYSSIAGSVSLIKSSFCVFGIVAVIAVNLPVLAEAAMYSLVLSFLSYISSAAGQKSAGAVFGCMKCTLRLLTMIAVMQIFIIVISTGLMLLIKGGV